MPGVRLNMRVSFSVEPDPGVAIPELVGAVDVSPEVLRQADAGKHKRLALDLLNHFGRSFAVPKGEDTSDAYEIAGKQLAEAIHKAGKLKEEGEGKEEGKDGLTTP